MLRLVSRVCALTTAVYLALATPALATTVHTNPSLALASKQVWALVIGALVPLVAYVLNHFAPWVSEPTKAVVLVVVSAVAGGLYTALATSSFGANTVTLEMVITSVVAALGAHHWLWKPSTISTLFGGGTNAKPTPKPPDPAA